MKTMPTRPASNPLDFGHIGCQPEFFRSGQAIDAAARSDQTADTTDAEPAPHQITHWLPNSVQLALNGHSAAHGRLQNVRMAKVRNGAAAAIGGQCGSGVLGIQQG